jgi:hypothetical protein
VRAVAVAVLAGAVLAVSTPVPVSDLPPDLRGVLSTELKFSPSDLAELEAGKIVARRLGAAAPGEVGAAGAVRVQGHKEALVDLYRDIVNFKRGPDVAAIGLFRDPPSIADLESLPLDTRDVNLRSCRVGNCDIRLPTAAILRFQHDVDWRASDADARAAALFKEVLIEHVRAYISGGGPGLITEYDDEKRPVRPMADFSGLLAGSSYIEKLVPGVSRHLQAFSSSPLAGGEDIIYWSKESMGSAAPFVTVTHIVIAQPTPASFVIASRDVYSSRYIDASLSLTIASDSVASPDAFYLVYVNRSRADALKGALAGLRRSIVERRVRASLEENLKLTKARLQGDPGK